MKRLVYIVDDQRDALDVAVALVRSIDPEWKVVGFEDPFKVLAAVRTTPPDLVLSDQRMPAMPGGQLLEKVRAAAPRAVRIIMSAYLNADRLSAISSAHQYLAKPFEAAKLAELIRRAFAAQERAERDNLPAVITGLRSLPSLPHLYHTLLAKLGNNQYSSTVIAQTISNDPGLATRVLQLANSPIFGAGSVVSDPTEAVLRLGTEVIKAVILSQETFKHYNHLKTQGIDLPRLWTHCWEVAQLAQRCCTDKELPREHGEEAFLSGLLHEIGRLAVLDNFADQFERATRAALANRAPLSQALREAIAVTPAQVAAYLLELWGMPAQVINAVARIEEPETDPAGHFNVTSALYVAHQICSKKSPPDFFVIPEWKTAYLQAVGCQDNIPEWEKLDLTTAAA